MKSLFLMMAMLVSADAFANTGSCRSGFVCWGIAKEDYKCVKNYLLCIGKADCSGQTPPDCTVNVGNTLGADKKIKNYNQK